MAFYEFHQFPGHQAWMHVGQIVRTAHWIGLHCMDGRRTKSSRLRAVAEEQLEEWRRIWWSLYCLDSYVNLATGTSFLIDDRLVNTAFPRPSPPLSGGSLSSQSQEPLLLPSELESLWKLVPVVTAGPQPLVTLNMHIVTTTTLRHAGRFLFSHLLRPSKETLSHFVVMDGPPSALQLALPPRYLHPGRNAFSNEPSGDHHARLVSVLHLRMSSLLTAIGRCAAVREEGAEWVTTWQRVLEICQDIAAVSKQWDGTFSLAVDPALAIILFTAAVFNNLQWKSAGNAHAALNASFQDCELVLISHLDQFARYWALPRLLKRGPASSLPLNIPFLLLTSVCSSVVHGFQGGMPRPTRSQAYPAHLRAFRNPHEPSVA